MNPANTPRLNWRALLLVAAAHLLVLLLILHSRSLAKVDEGPAPLMVSLLSAPLAAPQEAPKPLPASPQPAAAPSRVAAPLVSARSASPESASQPLPASVSVVPSVQAQPDVAPAVAAAPVVAASTSQEVAAPRFDADYLDNPAPLYPPLSRKLGEGGRVLLHVFVAADGQASKVDIRESSGFERLDRAARDAVQRWRFVPARQGDKAVAAWVLVPVSFSLRS